jgi:predicted dehydrogenase
MITVAIGVIGAGLIGRRHAEHIGACPGARLAGIADPAPGARELAASLRCPWFEHPEALLAARPDGVIVATPNALHEAHGRAAIQAGIPVLVEKPLAHDAQAAARLVAAARAAGVALLVGHHRRHNPRVAAARAAIASGRLGRVVAVHGSCWFHKPAAYFEAAWRRLPGAGPILINMVHDVDLLRHLVGEIEAVQALTSSAVRGHAVEDSAVVLLRFAGGALGTLTLSDTIASPWSWELTSGENAAYPRTGETSLMIGGTEASLALPQLALWRHDGAPDWMHGIGATALAVKDADPLARQILQFRAVILGEAAPLVPGEEGLATLRAIEAITLAARGGSVVEVGL